jgi:hypothetical protein
MPLGSVVGNGVLLRRSLESDGLRNDPFTLANEGLVEIDGFLADCCFRGLLEELELEIEFSRSLCLRPFRSPTFSTVSSVHDRSALNMVAPAIELANKGQTGNLWLAVMHATKSHSKTDCWSENDKELLKGRRGRPLN